MPRLVGTPEFVVVKLGDEYGIAATTKSKYGVTVVERPVKLTDGDALDAITVCVALNGTLERKK